jgi:protein-S-isoprenylcysteine O-methyltransferase Ste14
LNSSLRALEHRVPPPLVALLLAAGMAWASIFGPGEVLSDAWRHAATLLLAVVGIGFDVLGLLAFRASRTTVNPLRPRKATALVTGGVYRVTRNPMYLGLALLLLAWAVHLSAIWPFIGVPLYVLYINRFQIEPEERAMREKFEAEFADYAKRVRRWL